MEVYGAVQGFQGQLKLRSRAGVEETRVKVQVEGFESRYSLKSKRRKFRLTRIPTCDVRVYDVLSTLDSGPGTTDTKLMFSRVRLKRAVG